MDDKTAALKKLQEIVERLRGPQGCPWDRAQKLADMGRYVLEEASEVADALEEGRGRPTRQVKEELGDLLMNIFLAARIAEDEGAFGLAEVAAEIAEKLVRRHPHVFGDEKVSSVDEVLANWNALKAEEQRTGGGRAPSLSRLDGVPRSLPPLERAFELGRRASKAGFDWSDAAGALAKVEEELEEARARLAEPGEALEDELGDLLFAMVNLCRKLNVRPDAVLRRALEKFSRRFHALEARLPELEKASLVDMEAVWQETKAAAGSEG